MAPDESKPSPSREHRTDNFGEGDRTGKATIESWSRWCDTADRANRTGLLAAGLAAIIVVVLAITGVWTMQATGVLFWLLQALPWLLGGAFFTGVGVAVPATLFMLVATWRIKSANGGTPSAHLPPLQGERFGDMRCVVLKPDVVSFAPTTPRFFRLAWRILLLLMSLLGVAVAVIVPFHVVGFWGIIKGISVGLGALAVAPFALNWFSGGWELKRVDKNRVLYMRQSALGRADRWSEIPVERIRRVRSGEGALGFWTVELKYVESDLSGAEEVRKFNVATFGTNKGHASWQAERLANHIRRWMGSD